MLEQIGRMRWQALSEQQTSLHETVQRRTKLRLWLGHHQSQQRVRELPPDRSPDLRHLLGRAEPSRSSRAISEACRLAGTARVGDGTAAAVCRASPSVSASNTAFVISSTNRGMPSVRSTISANT